MSEDPAAAGVVETVSRRFNQLCLGVNQWQQVPTKAYHHLLLCKLAKSEVEKFLQSGLGDFTLRELLGALLSRLAHAERSDYLQARDEDKANGFYPRSLLVGSVPVEIVEIEVPRTRSGQFRPPSLPARYQRGYSEETQSLLLGLLSSRRSVAAAR